MVHQHSVYSLPLVAWLPDIWYDSNTQSGSIQENLFLYIVHVQFPKIVTFSCHFIMHEGKPSHFTWEWHPKDLETLSIIFV